MSAEWSAGRSEGYGRRLPRWLNMAGALVLLVTALLWLLLNFPVAWLLPEDRFSVTYMDRVTLGRGRIWVAYQAPEFQPDGLPVAQAEIAAIAGVNEMRWQWCPRSGLLNWCVEFENALGRVAGVVSPEREGLSATRVVGEFALSPGQLPASGRVLLELAKLRLTDLNCPLSGGAEIVGDMRILNVEFMSAPLGDHRLLLASVAPGQIDLDIKGDTTSGELVIDRGEVAGTLQLRPPAVLSQQVAAIARPLGDGSFQIDFKGKVPCLSGGNVQ